MSEYNQFKQDENKIHAALPLQDFPKALKAVARVGQFGNQKYDPHSWRKVPDNIERYTQAMIRHLLEDMNGNKVDDESGLLHYAHFVWCALATLELRLSQSVSSYVEGDNFKNGSSDCYTKNILETYK